MMRAWRVLLVVAAAAAVLGTHVHAVSCQGTLNAVGQSLPVFAVSGPVNPSGSSLGVPYNQRAYLGKAGTCNSFNRTAYYQIPLLGKTLSYTIDISQVAVGCNAAVYLVSMPAAAAGQTNDYYCDANQVGGSWCTEMDLIEANAAALAVTPHKCDTATGPCDKGGCSKNSRNLGNFFGVGRTITPQQPFTMSFTFKSSGNKLSDIAVVIAQNGKSYSMSFGNCGSGYLQQMTNAVASGMVLTVSYWGASNGGMSWLDGNNSASCPGSGKFTVSNISVN